MIQFLLLSTVNVILCFASCAVVFGSIPCLLYELSSRLADFVIKKLVGYPRGEERRGEERRGE